jgi:saposin
MLEMYVQKAIDVINTDYTPDVLCAEAKLCPGDEPSEADEARVATEPTEIPASLREVIERGSAVDAPAPPHPSTDCLKCEFGVESLHAAITSNATVQSIMNEAEKACEKYAAAFDMSATCEAAIETYGPELVDAAGKYIEDAHKVCSELGMCIPPSSETVVTELGEAEAKRLRRRERMKKLKARAMAVAGLKLKNIVLI